VEVSDSENVIETCTYDSDEEYWLLDDDDFYV
jgi:hypothetical protein